MTRSLGAALLFVLCLAARAVGEEPRISAIEIRRLDVFSEAEAAEAFVPYGAANALHRVTSRRFIERELLFEVGGRLDPEALAQTERNLRATRLFRSVSVRAEGTKVIVETEDAWTVTPRAGFSRKGGFTTYQLGLHTVEKMTGTNAPPPDFTGSYTMGGTRTSAAACAGSPPSAAKSLWAYAPPRTGRGAAYCASR